MKLIFNQSAQLLVMIVGIVICSTTASASDMQVGRYLSASNKPLPQQKDLMQQIVEVHFPTEITTVGLAINYLLKPSGYTLASMETAVPAVKNMMLFNLPIVDRDFGPMTLEDALKTLVGRSFLLKIDRLNRQVSFQPNTKSNQ